jgi:hypothetical protein
LHSVESLLTLMMVHLLKLHARPDDQACAHGRGKVVAFRNNARRRFAPAMRQRIDVGVLYSEAVEQLRKADPAVGWPDESPFSLDQLLNDKTDTLLGFLPPMPS